MIKTWLAGENDGSLILAASLVLLSWTQLRATSAPIGPGELAVSTWIVGVLVMHWYRNFRGESRKVRWLTPLNLFWCAALFIFILGWIATLGRGISPLGSGRDLVAYLFSAVLCAVVSSFFDKRWTERMFKGYAIVFLATNTAMFFVSKSGIIRNHILHFWYSATRFQGLSNNPNQLALYLLPLPFLFLHFRQTSQKSEKFYYSAATLLSLILGFETESDGLILAWICGFSTFAIFLLVREFCGAGLVDSPSGSWLTVLVQKIPPSMRGIVLTVMLVASAVLFSLYAEKAYASHDNHGGARVVLWIHGLVAWAQSPWVGNGPGAFSGLLGPMGGSESHNLFVDWAAGSGVLGMLLLFALFTWAVLCTTRSEGLWLISMLVSTVGLCLTYSTSRQPMLWIMIAYLTAYSKPDAKLPELT